MFVMDNERADLATASALSLLEMLTWLGIQHRTILFPEFVRAV